MYDSGIFPSFLFFVFNFNFKFMIINFCMLYVLYNVRMYFFLFQRIFLCIFFSIK